MNVKKIIYKKNFYFLFIHFKAKGKMLNSKIKPTKLHYVYFFYSFFFVFVFVFVKYHKHRNFYYGLSHVLCKGEWLIFSRHLHLFNFFANKKKNKK